LLFDGVRRSKEGRTPKTKVIRKQTVFGDGFRLKMLNNSVLTNENRAILKFPYRIIEATSKFIVILTNVQRSTIVFIEKLHFPSNKAHFPSNKTR